MSNMSHDDEFFEYLHLINKSISVEDKPNLCSLSTKQSSPSSLLNSRSHRLKCFTEFTSSPEINEQAFYSNKSTSNFNMLNKSQEDWNEKSKNDPKSYEFTYKILFNADSFEKEKLKSEEKNNFSSINKNNSQESSIEMQEEIQSKVNQFCLCNLDVSQAQTRNIKISDPQINIEYIYSIFRNFGEVSNIDVCDLPHSLILSFYDLNSSIQCVNFITTQQFNQYSDLSFVASLNDCAFLDYIIVKENFEYKNEDFESFFSLFGQIYEVNYLKKYVILKYSNLKSIKKLEKCLLNFKTDQKSQLKFLKNIFLNISEDFMRNLLSKAVILSKQNYNEFYLNSMEAERNYELSQDDRYFNEQEKENCPPNYYGKNKKKPLKLTSTVFSLSEISSVNDVNQCNISNKYGDYNSNMNSKQNFIIDVELIKEGIEKRTTIMIRNIPNRYNQESLLRVIDVKFKGMYDFVYLPMDFKNKCNIGYAFVNFISKKCIFDFYIEFHNKRWDLLRSEKICCVCFARIQGRNQLIKHFKKSNVIHMPLDKNYKPLILPNPLLDSQMLQIHSFD